MIIRNTENENCGTCLRRDACTWKNGTEWCTMYTPAYLETLPAMREEDFINNAIFREENP